MNQKAERIRLISNNPVITKFMECIRHNVIKLFELLNCHGNVKDNKLTGT